MTVRTKDPNSNLDYVFEWSDWLQGDDEIAHSDWRISPVEDGGLTITSTFSDSQTRRGIIVDHGRAGHLYRVTCSVTTLGGLRIDRSITVKVLEL